MSKSVGKNCPLCGSDGRTWIIKDNVPLRKCCGVLLAWNWPSVEKYESMYRSMDYHRDACIAQGLPTQMDRFEEHRKADQCRIQWLREHLDWDNFKVLDVGCSNGAFVYAAIHDYPCEEVLGLEPNWSLCEIVASQHEIPIFCGEWQDIDTDWDLTVANDVIEHLTDPEGFLSKCLEHSNYLYMETPDWDESRDENWKHIKVSEHICLFSRKSLIELSERVGWNVKEVYNPIPGKLAVLLEK